MIQFATQQSRIQLAIIEFYAVASDKHQASKTRPNTRVTRITRISLGSQLEIIQ